MSGAEIAAMVPYFSAAGSVASAVGSIAQGNQQKSMANYNAQVAEQQAAQTREAVKFEEQRLRSQNEKLRSAQKAGYAKAGVTQEGSPLLVGAETEADAELDALALRYSGSVAEARARSQAGIDRMRGKAAQTAGYIGAGASLLKGASQFPWGK